MRTDDLETIRVLATFTGIRGITPWYALASNSLNPYLRIGSEGIAYRVLKASQARFEEIETITLMSAFKTLNLHFRFRTGPWTFTANVGNRETARTVCERLPASLRFTL